jgi:hypothetical protein
LEPPVGVRRMRAPTGQKRTLRLSDQNYRKLPVSWSSERLDTLARVGFAEMASKPSRIFSTRRSWEGARSVAFKYERTYNGVVTLVVRDGIGSSSHVERKCLKHVHLGVYSPVLRIRTSLPYADNHRSVGGSSVRASRRVLQPGTMDLGLSRRRFGPEFRGDGSIPIQVGCRLRSDWLADTPALCHIGRHSRNAQSLTDYGSGPPRS